MMKDIIEIYKEFTFEEGHGVYCGQNPDKSNFLKNGQHLVKVTATLQFNESYIPDGYKTEHEAYSLNIRMSDIPNEGIVADLQAKYYPGYVRGLDSLF